jgi:hypothetical protein
MKEMSFFNRQKRKKKKNKLKEDKNKKEFIEENNVGVENNCGRGKIKKNYIAKDGVENYNVKENTSKQKGSSRRKFLKHNPKSIPTIDLNKYNEEPYPPSGGENYKSARIVRKKKPSETKFQKHKSPRLYENKLFKESQRKPEEFKHSKSYNKCQNRKKELKLQDLKLQDLKLQDLKLQDLKLQDLKLQNLKLQDLKSQDLKSQDLKLQKEQNLLFEIKNSNNNCKHIKSNNSSSITSTSSLTSTSSSIEHIKYDLPIDVDYYSLDSEDESAKINEIEELPLHKEKHEIIHSYWKDSKNSQITDSNEYASTLMLKPLNLATLQLRYSDLENQDKKKYIKESRSKETLLDRLNESDFHNGKNKRLQNIKNKNISKHNSAIFPKFKQEDKKQESHHHERKILPIVQNLSSEDWETSSSFSGFINPESQNKVFTQRNFRKFESEDKKRLLQDIEYVNNLAMWDIHTENHNMIEFAFWKIKRKDIEKLSTKLFLMYNYVSFEKINKTYIVIKTKRIKSQ